MGHELHVQRTRHNIRVEGKFQQKQILMSNDLLVIVVGGSLGGNKI